MVGLPGAPTASRATAGPSEGRSGGQSDTSQPSITSSQKTLLVLYGSNAGTCKAFAEEIQSSASQHGFSSKVQTMDSAVERLPTDEPVIIVTPSYEGKPADNAKKFVSWLEANASSSDTFSGVRYSVFGVGNSEWQATFHRIPRLVDELMNKMGATRFLPAGLCDANADILGPWEDWQEKLWNSLGEEGGVNSAVKEKMQVKIEKPEQSDLLAGSETAIGIIRENRQLAAADIGSEKRHLDIELPRGMSYRTGSHERFNYVLLL